MQRILIVRSSAIGDVVFASPMAACLKARWPGCHIAWLVEPAIAPLIAADPAIDECIPWPKQHWQTLWRTRRLGELWQAIRALRARLRAGRFDLVLDLQGLLKSGLLAWLSGAPRRISLGGREGSRWLVNEVVPRAGEAGRIGSEYRFLAQHLGLPAGEFVPHLHLGAPAVSSARAILARAGLAPAQRYAVLAPFTTRPQKHWFVQHWRALIPQLAALGLTPVVLGGAGEREAARALLDGLPAGLDLCGQTRLDEAAALVSGAALLIGVDTGLTHMGIAFATPTVALFGSTRPYLDPLRANARVIWLGLPCSPCRRRPRCDGRFDCLAELSPGRVMEEVAQVLAAPGSTR